MYSSTCIQKIRQTNSAETPLVILIKKHHETKKKKKSKKLRPASSHSGSPSSTHL